MRLLVLNMVLPPLLLAGLAYAGELVIPPVSYPQIIAHATTIDAFVPRGWAVESKVTGDLNGDGRPDVAILLRDTDPKNIIDGRSAYGPEHFDTNPYMLLVLLANANGEYDLALQDHAFVGRPNYPVYQSRQIGIKRGVLVVQFTNSAADDFEPSFEFRWQDGRWMLIGYDYIGASHGEYLAMSANLLTGYVQETRGIVTGPKGKDHPKTKSAHTQTEPLMALEQLDAMKYRPKQLCVLEAWMCKRNGQ